MNRTITICAAAFALILLGMGIASLIRTGRNRRNLEDLAYQLNKFQPISHEQAEEPKSTSTSQPSSNGRARDPESGRFVKQ